MTLAIAPELHAAPGAIEQKLTLLDRLLDAPTTSARVGASADADAATYLAAARQARAASASALAASDPEAAEQHANDGLELVSRALRAAGSAPSQDEAASRYRRTYERTVRFAEAFDRIAREKGPAVVALLDRAQWNAALAEARGLADSGDFARANEHLDRCAADIETALSEARANETLVHELVFATREEAYHYELKRNDSYAMLVDLLERGGERASLAALKRELEHNREVRSEAEALFARGEVDAAVERLERSTEALARALRRSGVGF